MKKIYRLGLFISFVFCALVVWATAEKSTLSERLTSTSFFKVAPPPDTAHGLIGYYYNNVPHPDQWFKKLIFSRVDNIQENLRGWDESPPDPRLDDEWFSIRWQGLYKAPESGEYQMLVYANDLCRIWINGELVLDNWDVSLCCANRYGQKKIYLKEGHYYPIKIDYGATTGTFTYYLGWVLPGGASVSGGPHNENFYAVVPKKVSSPKIVQEEGRYEDSVDVTIKSSSTSGAVVRYTMDGTAPTELSPVIYGKDTTFTLKADATIKVNAVANGMLPSATISRTYTVIPPLVSTPTFFPTEGVYGDPINLGIKTREDSTTIYYTLDGSIPDTNSMVYTDSIKIDSTTRVKALAVKPGMTPSKTASATYTLLPPAAAAPVFSVSSGSYSKTQEIEITSATSGAIIHYALNDEVLNDASPVYTSPLEISKTTTLRAYAEKGDLRTSNVTEATYDFGEENQKVAPPQFSLPPGSYDAVKQVNITTDTKGANIYYTLDGNEPDKDSPLFFAPLLIKDSVTLKAFATKAGMTSSDIVSATYIAHGTVVDTGVVKDELPEPFVKISPNPASDKVRISWYNMIYTEEGAFITVTDSRGAVMKSLVVKGGYTYYVLNTTRFAPGVYFIRITSGSSVVKGKVIINQ